MTQATGEKKEPLTLVVSGAKGKMGTELLKTVCQTPGIRLTGAVSRTVQSQQTVGDFLGRAELSGIVFEDNLKAVLQREKPDVCVDLTTPEVVFENTVTIIEAGCRPVVGTTGLTEAQLKELDQRLQASGLGGMVVPNFSIGAVLMMKFAQMAAQYFDHAEIIELHHNQKADAPSGTAIKTAELMKAACKQFGSTNASERESLSGVRGGMMEDSNIRIHSVRLPGYLAHQEVLFGASGQRLSVRHDTMDRACFMSGIVLCVQKVMSLKGLTYGLETLL